MQPGYSFMPPGVGNYGEPAYMDYKDESPIDREEKAKELLKEAGFGPGKPLKVEIRYNTTDNNRNTVIAVAEQWKQLGVETSFINTDGKTHFAHLRDGGDFDVARYGWIADYSDPKNFLFLLKSDNKGFNYGKYNNPEFDELLKQAPTELDLKKRAEHHAQGRGDPHEGHALDPGHVLRQEPPDLAEDPGLRPEHPRRLSDALPVEDAVSTSLIGGRSARSGRPILLTVRRSSRRSARALLHPSPVSVGHPDAFHDHHDLVLPDPPRARADPSIWSGPLEAKVMENLNRIYSSTSR